MMQYKSKLIPIVSFGVIAVTICALFVYGIIHPDFGFISALSGLSSLFVAVLTVVYVYVTTNQLDVMKKQLAEIKMEREMQNQPMPWVEAVTLKIERPEFIYNNQEKTQEYSSDYTLELIIKNVGHSPLICADVTAKLNISDGEEEIKLVTNDLRINILEEKLLTKEGEVIFKFKDDLDGKLLDALLKGRAAIPILKLRIIYRSIMGGCFSTYSSYELSIDQEEDTIKDWVMNLKTFSIFFKSELDDISNLEEGNNEKWEEKFLTLQKSAEERHSGQNESVRIQAQLITNSFIANPIGKNEYNNHLKKLGKQIPKDQ